MEEKKDYERYLEQDEESWGEFFHNMSMYWKGLTADVCGDMKEFLYDYGGVARDIAENPDDPEMMDLAVESGRLRSLALVSEKAMHTIGSCLDATDGLFGGRERQAGRVHLSAGDHLLAGKKYHGVYAGGKTVICFTKENGRGEVRRVPFDKFAEKGRVSVVPEDVDIPTEHSPDEIVRRAASRLGERDFRNSESFVQWCRCGNSGSSEK